MIDTLTQLAFPFLVLTIAGVIIFAVAWWATLRYEANDGWLFGDEPE